MSVWLGTAIQELEGGRACVLVTIVEADGSTPREAGTKMLVHRGGIEDSIGGGHLEMKAIEQARTLLDKPAPPMISAYALGPSLGQCCGGHVSLMLERLDQSSLPWLRRWLSAQDDEVLVTSLADGSKAIVRELADEPIRLQTGIDGQPCYARERMKSAVQDLYLFGAGHVGRALVHVLTGLPYRIRWFDERSEMFPPALPAEVTIEASTDARRDVASAPPGAIFLIMTHSHALDFDICDQILRRGDFAFLGLIGSATKRATFERRLKLRGHGDAAIRRLVCPIGLASIAGKAPAVVAISVAGQLLALSQAEIVHSQQPIVRRRKA
jgi:xanthine dehydrogenase accessory factor